jgi:dihydrofolate reductase
MPIVRAHLMMSVDGYLAGLNMTVDKPFGDGVEGFLDWVFRLKSFREVQGLGSDGETGRTDDVMRETFDNLGATVMGRNMFGPGPGPWPASPPWNGWWGENPPFHHPVFVLTHHPREALEMQGGTTFYFVTDGIDSALRRAKDAAGDRDVRIGGGADVVNQCLAAGLIDEIELHIVPKLIGDGKRLFAGLGPNPPRLEQVRSVAGPAVTHVKYRLVK